MRQCAVKFISLQVHSTCFGRHTRPSSGVQINIKYAVLSDLMELFYFLGRYSKIREISNFFKGRPVRAELLFHADGRRGKQTDMTKLIVTFRNFANAYGICEVFNL